MRIQSTNKKFNSQNMISFFRKSIFGKVLSQVLLVSFVGLSVYPYQASAFEGPKQPELTSFTLASSNEMVDLFSGDFQYNIPILHVPGPGGGYPINLAYNGGSPDQEASWVGWGWNINPGAINRQMRGLPDDFDGNQRIKKTYSSKTEHNFAINLGVGLSELLGADLDKSPLDLKGNMNVLYNNKRGWNIRFGLDLGLLINEAASSSENTIPEAAEDLDMDTPSYCLPPDPADKARWEVLKDPFKGAIENANEGVKEEEEKSSGNFVTSLLAGASFSNLHPLSYNIKVPRSTHAFSFQGKLGPVIVGVTADIPYKAMYSYSKIAKPENNYKAYGYFNSEKAYGESGIIMDYERDNDALITTSTKLLPLPIQTYDLFQVSSQDLGGIFRAYRNDIPVYTSQSVASKSNSTGFGLEFNSTGGDNKFGGSLNFHSTEEYTGPWNMGSGALNDFKSPSAYLSNEMNKERAYFKFMGERNESNSQTSNLSQSYKAQRNQLKTRMGNLAPEVELIKAVSGKSGVLPFHPTVSLPKERDTRAKSISHLTLKEVKDLYPVGIHPSRNFDYSAIPMVDGANDYSNTIAEFRVTREDGHRVHFGIPVYTLQKKEVAYSTESFSYGNQKSDLIPNSVAIDNAENSKDNDHGTDGIYSETITPKYAHSFLITESLSSDYADVDGQLGPSEGDLGTYVKFDWDNKGTFSSRKGVEGKAVALAGNLSDKTDDRAAYLYTEKEYYALSAIETKTHKAVFNYVEDRLDGRSCCQTTGNNSQYNAAGNQRVRLESIDLFALDHNGGQNTLIQTVHFKHGYLHWEGTPSSASETWTQMPAGSKAQAKLTLKEVYTTYGRVDNGGTDVDVKTKASTSKYVFHYEDSNYGHSGDRDRWGNYQAVTDNEYGTSNNLFPYTIQEDRSLADQNASKGLLNRIETPAGGQIRVEYEADDYAYVQDKKAERLFKIVGFSATGTTTPEAVSSSNQDLSGKRRIYFELEKDENGTPITNISKYTEGLENVYFKTLSVLKNKPLDAQVPGLLEKDGDVLDYVDGYAVLDNSASPPYGISSNGNYGWIQIKNADVNGISVHPMQIAAIHHIKYHRPDLVNLVDIDFSGSIDIKSAASAVNKIVNSILDDLTEATGFYIRSYTRGYGSKVNLEASRLPSTIRLKDPDGHKVGGGSRVKAIHIDDRWDQMTSNAEDAATYSRYFFYENPDGTSSGVATFEPFSGIEDNPLRQPVYSNASNNVLVNDKALVTHLPVGEALYPASSVGYSRITVFNNSSRDSEEFGNGINEEAFYTARDYPVKTDYTRVDRKGMNDFTDIMAFLGLNKFQNEGLSQGYSIRLNNMHGKKKYSATFKSTDVDLEKAVSKTTYFYKTQGVYDPGSSNELLTSVDVQDHEYAVRNSIKLGEQMDVCIDLREAETKTKGAGMHLNLMFIWGIPIPVGFPNPEFSSHSTKTAVLSKVFNQTATLDKIVTENDGAINTIENLLFDPLTGAPLYVQTDDQFGQYTYTQTYPARWYYPQVDASYKNEGLWVSSAEAADYMIAGDELMDVNGNLFWVNGLDSQGQVLVASASNTESVIPAGDYKVLRSGNRNLLTQKVGAVVSTLNLQDPANQPNTANFEMWNRWLDSDFTIEYIEDCVTGDRITQGPGPSELIEQSLIGDILTEQDNGAAGWGDLIQQLTPYYGQMYIHIEDPCPAMVIYPKDFTAGNLDPRDFYLYKTGYQQALAVKKGDPTTTYSCVLAEYSPCDYTACVSGILEANAIDIAAEGNTLSDNEKTLPAKYEDNPYRYNLKGVTHVQTSFRWMENRIQQGVYPTFQSKAGQDGTFEKFSFFQWPAGQEFHSWYKNGVNTLFDLDGNPLESQDPLGVYSSRILSFCNNLVVASAENARYDEIAFSSFENDYSCAEVNGHLDLSSGTFSTESHTGSRSYLYESSNGYVQLNNQLNLRSNKAYTFRAWVKKNSGQSSTDLVLNSGGGDVPLNRLSPWIDGWALHEVQFTGGNNLYLKGTTDWKVDDIKIYPTEAGMVCFVYDSATMRIVAEMGDSHYTKFYTYDEEGMVTGTKVETPEGIQTLESTYTSPSQNP